MLAFLSYLWHTGSKGVELLSHKDQIFQEVDYEHPAVEEMRFVCISDDLVFYATCFRGRRSRIQQRQQGTHHMLSISKAVATQYPTYVQPAGRRKVTFGIR